MEENGIGVGSTRIDAKQEVRRHADIKPLEPVMTMNFHNVYEDVNGAASAEPISPLAGEKAISLV
jgi:hypothetical protein